MGYGFGDEHVTRVIETALMNPSLIMLVVEPDPNSKTIERIERYKELGKESPASNFSEQSSKAMPKALLAQASQFCRRWTLRQKLLLPIFFGLFLNLRRSAIVPMVTTAMTSTFTCT